jgi:hypothetical protein
MFLTPFGASYGVCTFCHESQGFFVSSLFSSEYRPSRLYTPGLPATFRTPVTEHIKMTSIRARGQPGGIMYSLEHEMSLILSLFCRPHAESEICHFL